MPYSLIIIGLFQLCLLLVFGIIIPMCLMHWQRVSYFKAMASLGYAGSKVEQEKKIEIFEPNKSKRAPGPVELAQFLGIPGFNDSRDHFIKDEKTGKMRKKRPHEYDDDGSTFSF